MSTSWSSPIKTEHFLNLPIVIPHILPSPIRHTLSINTNPLRLAPRTVTTPNQCHKTRLIWPLNEPEHPVIPVAETTPNPSGQNCIIFPGDKTSSAQEGEGRGLLINCVLCPPPLTHFHSCLFIRDSKGRDRSFSAATIRISSVLGALEGRNGALCSVSSKGWPLASVHFVCKVMCRPGVDFSRVV